MSARAAWLFDTEHENGRSALTATDKSLIIISTCIWVLTMPLQTTIAGRMQIANLGDVLSILLLVPVFGRLPLDRASLYVIFVSTVFLAISSVFALTMPFGAFLAIFYVVATVHVLALYNVFRVDKELLIRTIKALVPITRILTVMIVAHFLVTRKVPYSFLMQDKTYFIVYLNSLVLIELMNVHFIKRHYSTLTMIVMGTLMVMELPTASRSIFLFAPFILSVAAFEINNRASAKTGRVLFVAMLIAAGVFVTINFEKLEAAAMIASRLTGLFEKSDTSSGQHSVLIIVAFQGKFQNFWTFLFGAGPAGFQNVALRSDLLPDLIQTLPDFGLAVFSPTFAYFPGTSIWVETFLEFPIFIWVPFVALFGYIGYRIVVQHRLVYSAYILALYATGIVYSLHHATFFYLSVVLICVLAFCVPETRRLRGTKKKLFEIMPPRIR